MTGTIAKLMKDKRFGFIKSERGTEYFFHQSALKNIKFEELEEGREVTFEDTEGVKGPRAEDIYV